MNKKEIFLKAFERHQVAKPPVRVKINGKFIKTCSGKAGWQTVAHAKAAIKRHVLNSLGWDDMRLLTGDGNYKDEEREWKNLLDSLIKDGTVEFC